MSRELRVNGDIMMGEEEANDTQIEVREVQENDRVHREVRDKGDLVDLEYDMEDEDNDMQQVLHELQKDRNEVKAKSDKVKRRPISSQQKWCYDASMRFEHNETYSKYGDFDELFSKSDSKGKGHLRYLEFDFVNDIGDPTFKIGIKFANSHDLKRFVRHMALSTYV
ncbi:hypothetical protein GH714_020560 [Hevea brasiliensis]|uniref:Uncharacterized protein n=1 Tax=Hevea brasiliensis TaxID=3981 RepID=A0A6A6KL93_HEVBR|nr:hypothetical protein GH714_020560 [Hevea brasiliensis]